MSDVFDKPEVKALLDQFEEDALPKIKDSALVCIIHGEPDAKLCLEVGAAVLYEKPLLLCVQPGVYVPPYLRKLASRIVEVDKNNFSQETKDRVHAAISAMVGELQRRQQ